MKSTRVTAKYIRKMAAKYNIEIKEQLRSTKVKNHYVELIAEAIIDSLHRDEIREHNIDCMKELNKALKSHSGMLAYNTQSLPFSTYLQFNHLFVGEVGVNILGQVWYRTFADSRNIQRPIASITEAVDRIAKKYFVSVGAA